MPSVGFRSRSPSPRGEDMPSVGSRGRSRSPSPSVGSRGRSRSPSPRGNGGGGGGDSGAGVDSVGNKRARDFGYDEDGRERFEKRRTTGSSPPHFGYDEDGRERFEKRRTTGSSPPQCRYQENGAGQGGSGPSAGGGGGPPAGAGGGPPLHNQSSSSEFWDPRFSDQFTINRVLFVRNVPRDMTDGHLLDFLNRAMQSVKLCEPTFRPINLCHRIPSNPFKCALLCHDEKNARYALNLNGIRIPTASYGDQSTRTAVELEILRHSRFRGPQDRPKHWNDIKHRATESLTDSTPAFPSRNDTVTVETDPRQDKRVFVGDLRMDVTQANLVNFLEKTMQDAGLIVTAPASSPDANKPLFLTCDLRVAPDKQRQYAIVEVRSPQEGLNMLHLNGIPYMGSAVLVKTAGLRYPNPKMPGANWLDFQRRLQEERQGKQGGDPRRDGLPPSSIYSNDKPGGPSSLRHESAPGGTGYLQNDISIKTEPNDDYRQNPDDIKTKGSENPMHSTSAFPSRNDSVVGETDARQDKKVFVGDLTIDVTQPKLLKFLDETMHDAGLIATPPASSPDANKPLFVSCDFRVAPDKQRQYAIFEVRSQKEGLNMLHLNGIPYMGSKLLIKTAGLRFPNPKMPGANWFNFQRRLQEERQGKQGGDPRRDGPSSSSIYSDDKPGGVSSSLRTEAVTTGGSRYLQNDSSYKNESYDDYRQNRDDYKRSRDSDGGRPRDSDGGGGENWQRKYEMLMEEYTELGKDFRRVSQSLAGVSEQQRQLQEEIQVEKGRRRDAEWDLTEERQRRERAERDLQNQECRSCREKERQVQDLQGDIIHLHRQLQDQQRQK